MANGHPGAFDYTPRMLAAFMHFAMRRRKREMAELLSVSALASRGDPKDLKKTLKDLGGE